jgi:hypothetical protein
MSRLSRPLVGALLASVVALTAAPAQVAPGPAMVPNFVPSAAGCSGAPATTNINAATGNTGATLTLTGVTVPTGSLIVVVVAEFNFTSTLGSVSDGLNTYSLAASQSPNNSAANGVFGVFYAFNAGGLSSGTITYTRNASGVDAYVSAFYATNVAASSPIDANVTKTGFGAVNSPTLTSGTPGQAGELFVAAMTFLGAGGIGFTQDTTNGWAAPPAATSVFDNQMVAGGSQVNAGTGTKTFHPTTTGTSPATASVILGFKHC